MSNSSAPYITFSRVIDTVDEFVVSLQNDVRDIFCLREEFMVPSFMGIRPDPGAAK